MTFKVNFSLQTVYEYLLVPPPSPVVPLSVYQDAIFLYYLTSLMISTVSSQNRRFL